MDAIQALRTLRAVRRYASRPIEPEVLGTILEAARWTGSAKNTQPWELVVVRDQARLGRLATCGPYAGHLQGAALGIALVMEYGTRRFDEGRLAQSLMLAAWAQGVGSCIASLYPEAENLRARVELGLPEGRWLRNAIAFGYPADERALRLSQSPIAGLASVPLGRRPVVELVSWEQYGHGPD